MIDARQPRFGQAITGTAVGLAFVLGWPAVLPAVALLLGAASILGPRFNLYAYLFRLLAPRLGPPRELEEEAPPRFANAVGFVFLTAASVAHYGFRADLAAWGLAVVVAALALLGAIAGVCVGCEIYVAIRRVLTGGRVPRRRVAVPEWPGAGG